MVIHKQTLKIAQIQTIELPLRAKILTCQVQGDNISMWYMFDEIFDTSQKRYFLIVPTGSASDLHSSDTYISTVQIEGLVFHIFETLFESPLKP